MNTSLLHSISERDIEKFKLIASIFNEANRTEIITLRVFEEEYLSFVKGNHSPSYVRSLQNTFKHFNGFFTVQKIITEINQKEAEQFMMYLQSKVKKGFRVYYRNLKAAFNKAVDWKYISVNPFIKIKLPKVQRSAPGFINGEQLWVICDGIENKVVRDVVKTAFYTGMRLNEVVNLRWRNIDFERRLIIVGDENFTTKSKKQRYVPVCEELVKLLKVKSETQVVNEGFVFCKPDGCAYTGDYASKCFKDACRSLGIDKAIHFHSLRHSFASNLVQKGVSLYVVKELLGHSSISTTEVYSHLNVESLREAVKKLDGNNIN